MALLIRRFSLPAGVHAVCELVRKKSVRGAGKGRYFLPQRQPMIPLSYCTMVADYKASCIGPILASLQFALHANMAGSAIFRQL